MRTAYQPRRRALAPLLLAALLLVLAGACGNDDDTTPTPAPAGGPDLALLAPDCFTGGDTPQLDLSGPVPDATWNDPHVLKVGDAYWMYASATDNFVFPVRLYRLTSTDGATWSRDPATPILSEGAAGEWDAGGVETPAVVEYGGQYHLFYTGYSVQSDVSTYAVGHATSPDGVTWTRDPANPVVTNSGLVPPDVDFRQYIAAEPGPVVVGDTLYLYFTAVGANVGVSNTLQVIGVTTFDGTTWSTPVSALEPDQTLYPRTADWIGYSTPNAIVLGGAVHLFFDVAHQPAGGEWLQMRLHHARSADGLTGWVQDAAPIFAREDFAWTAREVRSPDPLLDGNTLRLWFAGDNLDFVNPPPTNHFGIGEATCDLTPP